MAGQGIPLGVGDLGLTHVLEFIEMMDYGGADICQPDISQVGRIHWHSENRGRSRRTR